MKTLAITGCIFAALLAVPPADLSFAWWSEDVLNYNYNSSTFGPLACKNGTAADSPYFRATAENLYETPNSSCGQTVDNPCIVARALSSTDTATTEPCGHCYLITLAEEEKTDGCCKGGKCPAYETTIMTQVQAAYKETRKSEWQLSFLGWSQICPAACRDCATRPTCVSSSNDCKNPYEDESRAGRGTNPGTVYVIPTPVAWQRVVCGTTEPVGDRWFKDWYNYVGRFPRDTAYFNDILNINWADSTFGPLLCKQGTSSDSPYFRATAADNHLTPGSVCGQTVNDPCIIGMELDYRNPATTAPCGKCYLITLKQKAVLDESCTGGLCPAFERTIMTQVQTAKRGVDYDSVEGHKGRLFDLSRLGWKQLCPASCGSPSGVLPICVPSEADCKIPSAASPSGAGLPIAPLIAWRRVRCGSTQPDGDFSNGIVGVFPPPTSA